MEAASEVEILLAVIAGVLIAIVIMLGDISRSLKSLAESFEQPRPKSKEQPLGKFE
jgi:hypothetical protein